MRIAVLTASPRGIASQFLAREPPTGVEVVAVLLDLRAVPDRLAWVRAKARKVRRLGPTTAPVGLLLRRAYARVYAEGTPDVRTLGHPVHELPSLNEEAARSTLRELDVSLAVSLDNRLLTRATYAIPHGGTVNLHLGAVPAYRGGPPVFWELHDGLPAVGYTVHRIDDGIDTGAVLASGAVEIVRRGTVAGTLEATVPALVDAGLSALTDVLAALARGEAQGHPQQEAERQPLRSTPSLGAYLRVRRSLAAQAGGSE